MKQFAKLDETGRVTHLWLFEPGAEPDDLIAGTDAVIDATWDGLTFTPPPAPVVPIEEQRAGMVCSPLQGRLALGEATCAAIDAMAADPATPWAMRQAILQAGDWRRTSQTMDELGYLLGYTPAQMDDLFRAAMTITV